MESHDRDWHAREREYERRDHDTDEECFLCDRAIKVWEDEDGEVRRADIFDERILCSDCDRDVTRREKADEEYRCEGCFEVIPCDPSWEECETCTPHLQP